MEDFWRMMWEYRCGCIVMLCQLEEDGQVCRPDIQRVCTGLCVSWTTGEQLSLLARRGGRGDGVWKTLCQTSQGQRSL